MGVGQDPLNARVAAGKNSSAAPPAAAPRRGVTHLFHSTAHGFDCLLVCFLVPLHGFHGCLQEFLGLLCFLVISFLRFSALGRMPGRTS